MEKIDLIRSIIDNIIAIGEVKEDQYGELFNKYYDMDEGTLIYWHKYYQKIINKEQTKTLTDNG